MGATGERGSRCGPWGCFLGLGGSDRNREAGGVHREVWGGIKAVSWQPIERDKLESTIATLG